MTDNLKLVNKTTHEFSSIEKIVRGPSEIRPGEKGQEIFIGVDDQGNPLAVACSAGINSSENSWLAAKAIIEK